MVLNDRVSVLPYSVVLESQTGPGQVSPEVMRKEFQNEEIVSETHVTTQAPAIQITSPGELTAPAHTVAPTPDKTPNHTSTLSSEPPPNLFDICERVIDNGDILIQFGGLATGLMFIANVIPNISTAWLLIALSIASLYLFRVLKL